MLGNIELTRAAFDAWNRGDREGWLAYLDPGIVFHPAGVFPDFESEFHGREGLGTFWDRLHEPWEELHAEIEQITDDGDVVVVGLRFDATSADGPPVALSLVTAVRIRDGLATQMVTQPTLEDARRLIDELSA